MNGSFYSLVDERNRQRLIIGGYLKVWIGIYQGAGPGPVSRQTEVCRRPTQEKQARCHNTTAEVDGEEELGGGVLIVRSRMLRDPAKVAPTVGEVEEYAEETTL